MLTVDDANTIMAKYGDCYFFHDYDFEEIGLDIGTQYEDDYATLTISGNHPMRTVRIYPKNDLFYTGYLMTRSGEMSNYYVIYEGDYFEINGLLGDIENKILRMFCTTFKVDYSEYNNNPLIFAPVSSLKKWCSNGEFDNKLYIKENPFYQNEISYFIDDVEIEKGTDEKGTFLILPSAEDCLIVPKTDNNSLITLPLKVTFHEFKSLPIPYIPTLYKGTPQSIQVLNTEDDDPISDYQTYYQGRTLKDNIIRLPYDSEDYVDIIVDLKDYRYPFATVKLKAPTVIYQANSQSDVETAIENGIQTLQVGDTETNVTLNAIELSNVTLINSNIQVSESILTDCQIIDSAYTDNGGNIITDTTYNNVTITSTETSTTYTDCILDDCTVTDAELHITGTLTNNIFNNTLIISDGIIATDNNIFNGVGSKTYFPSHLYLTGEFTLNNNTFNLTGEWEELQYNMCIIKATSNFNPSEFINKNTFNLNITYEDEPTNTFYYNIVDDDKIRAVRL